MKPLFLLTIILVFNHYTSYSQRAYKFDLANPGLFFRLQTTDTVPDTLSKRVVHFYSGQQKISSFVLSVNSYAGKVSYTITDSLIYDSVVYDSAYKHNFIPEQSRLILLDGADMYIEFPYEDVLLLQSTLVKPADSAVTAKKAPGKKFSDMFSVHGFIRINAQVADNKYLFQQVPADFFRYEINTDINLFGVPFSAGYYQTTENNGLHPINNFRLSFLYEKFEAGIKDQLVQKIKTDQFKNIDLRSEVDIADVNKELLGLSKEVDAEDFKKRYQRNLFIIDAAEKDTSLKASSKYKRALKQKSLADKKMLRIKSLKDLQGKYSRELKFAGIQAGANERKLSKPGNLRAEAKKYKLVNSFQSLFLSVRRFDLGTFDPQQSSLILNGVNLTGINMEINPGYFYGAFTWGKVINNYNFPLAALVRPSSGQVLAWRTGAGIKDKFLVTVSMLKGESENGRSVLNSKGEMSSSFVNHVIGAEAVYKFAKTGEAGIEYAKSRNYSANQEYNLYIGSRETLKANPEQYSSAWNAFTRVVFNNGNTSFKTLVRVVDPFYYSVGTPYLRKDNLRLEAKAEQFFLKRKISTGITFRSDRDNLYNLKQGTSRVYSTVFSTQLRFRKLPYLIVTYSPNFQYFFNAVHNRNIFSRTIFYNVLSGYTYQSKSVVINTNVSYSNQSNHSNQEELIAYEVKQFSLMESILFKPYSFTLSAAVTYVIPKERKDTGEIFMTTLSVSGPLFKKRINYTAGGRYLKDFAIQERYIAEASLSFVMAFRITTQLGIEKHFINNFYKADGRESMILGRISLIKLF